MLPQGSHDRQRSVTKSGYNDFANSQALALGPGRVERVRQLQCKSIFDRSDVLEVQAHARLHFGLFNESGLGDHIDGGAGLAIEEPSWRLRIRCRCANTTNDASSPVLDTLEQLQRYFGNPQIAVRERCSIPFHVGLGARTSLTMAIGTALAACTGATASYLQIAALGKRGGTSGVGVHAAYHGGLVVDAGHRYPSEKARFGPSSEVLAPPPPLRFAFSPPAKWQVVHLTLAGSGLYGQSEVDFFEKHCPVPESETKTILRLVDSVMIPALESNDLAGLQAFLDETQTLGLKNLEWGKQDTKVQDLRAWWRRRREVDPALSPLCLSSMGPTVFMISEDSWRELAILQSISLGVKVTVTRIARTGVRLAWRRR